MAIDLLDEHEQGERVRAWLRNNATAILGGVALGLAAIFGWQWYQRAQIERQLTAAVQFDALEDAIERSDTDAAAALAAEMEKRDGVYARLAALRQSEAAFDRGDIAQAVMFLEGARSDANRDRDALDALIALRLARLELARDDGDAALARIANIGDDSPYAGLAAELRGDALSQLQRNDEAVAAYRKALQFLDASAPTRSIIEMKLADLGVAAADVVAGTEASAEA